MKNLTETIVNNYGGKTIWMTFIFDDGIKVMFSDRKKSLGKIVFKDITIAEGIYKYLENRLPKITYSSAEKWIDKLTKMDGCESLLFLSTVGRTLTKREVLGLIRKIKYTIDDDMLVAKDDETDYIGEFKFIQFNKYEFKYY